MNALDKKTIWMSIILTAILAGLTVGTKLAYAESPIIRWERIEGIDPSATGQIFHDIRPVTFPWSTTRGSALLNVGTARLQFHVEGLSMGASPTPLALIGTTGVVTAVKGTVICQQSGEFADSEAVELSPEGDAIFSGELLSVPYCEASDLIFLLRIAAVVPGAPPIINLWLAHGAVRKFQ